MARSPKYDDARYGVIHRSYFEGKTNVIDPETQGTVADMALALPVKARIIGFGVQSQASDIVFGTSCIFELRTANGTKLATINCSTTLGTNEATSAAPETATSIGANRGMVVCVGTATAASGSVRAFVDWVVDLDDTHDP